MRFLKTNWFGLLLMVSYLAVFHLWMHLDRPGILLSASITVGMLLWLQLRAFRSGYFHNRWDVAVHASVILDIGLEGALIPIHDNRGFYLCALAFIVVIAWYRWNTVRGIRLST